MNQQVMTLPTAAKEGLSWVQNDYVTRVFDRIDGLLFVCVLCFGFAVLVGLN